MSESCEVAVVGGGAAGSAVCHYLALAGVDVVLVERDGVAAHASGYSAGGLNPLQGAGIPGPLGPMAIESYRMHLALWEPLMAETGVDFSPRIISVVAAAFDEPELADICETAELHESEEGFSGTLLDESELYRMVPGLAPGAVGGVRTRGNAALDSYLYTVALARRAEQLGARVRKGSARGLRTDGDRVEAVLLEDGELSCGEVVLAMGPWSETAEIVALRRRAGHARSGARSYAPTRPAFFSTLTCPGLASRCTGGATRCGSGRRRSAAASTWSRTLRCGGRSWRLRPGSRRRWRRPVR